MTNFTIDLVNKIEEYIGDFKKKFEDQVNDITFSTLNDQKKAFECCSNCISKYIKNSNKKKSLEDIQDCIRKCQDPIETFQNKVNSELNIINEKVINCQQQCFNKFENLFKKPKDLLNNLNKDHDLIKCYVQCFTDNYPTLTETKNQLINRK
ncbi:C2C2 zinc finger domain-containing protein [Cryptosporidium ubiquitum]|uniref:C2C2 zinc finger domain-containing protein n=1 Tax=Cryptosporidium ubiquitum TaxID=857276 RepID=A0A1J4MN82_9CRYT|nr:C2C2 zinc finger domain-containing protein [Cryptosporidium ubiquitum]OII74492.1 C2C2 zinc finger domain-containing protein [Cryptosporidium ubiquitum]